MHTLNPAEFLVVAFVALIKFGIPIMVAVWVIQTLRHIRSDVEALKARFDAIEERLRPNS